MSKLATITTAFLVLSAVMFVNPLGMDSINVAFVWSMLFLVWLLWSVMLTVSPFFDR